MPKTHDHGTLLAIAFREFAADHPNNPAELLRGYLVRLPDAPRESSVVKGIFPRFIGPGALSSRLTEGGFSPLPRTE